MNDDFGTTLTALLDDVAASIEPIGDFEAVRDGRVAFVSDPYAGARARGARRFRRPAAVAAATIALVGGSVAAYQGARDDAGVVATSSGPASTAVPTTLNPVAPATSTPGEPDAADATEGTAATSGDTAPEPTGDEIAYTADVAHVDVSGAAPQAKLTGTARAGDTVVVTTAHGGGSTIASPTGKWYVLVSLPGAPVGDLAGEVSFPDASLRVAVTITVPAAPAPEPEPAPETSTTVAPTTTAKPVTTSPEEPPKEPPAAPAFTATLGWTEGDGTPLDAGLWGKAAPGSVVTAASPAGSASTTVRPDGHWEMILRLDGLAPGAKVAVVVTNSADGKVYEFHAKAPHQEGASKPFTAELGNADFSIEPAKQMIVGTGATGSVVRAESAYGVAETTIGHEGKYDLKLKLAGAPAGTVVRIRVTNTASEVVREFDVVRQAPTPIGFSANAKYTECDSTPPFNEYWGTAPVGATITITSPYGGGQVTANEHGKWSARIEFPDAPVGTVFDVAVTSNQGGSASFPLVRVNPA
jgi:hypothetical protein